jgi:hypothetical protein
MSVKQELDKFGKFVIQQSRTRLTKEKKNTSKKLYDSLDYDLKVTPRSFSLTFVMEKYGQFVDKGVQGAVSSTKAPDSPFKFKNKMPPRDVFVGWIKAKPIQGRNKKGQFISRNSLAFLIQRSVYEKGLKTTNFFTTPFEQAFKKLPDELIEAYALEVEELLKFSTK